MGLKILGRNETGYGYLIERFEIKNEQELQRHFLKESTKLDFEEATLDQTSPFESNQYIYAVLQKYGIENENGRIYSKEILEREVARYMELIKDGSAIGETDHPESAIISLANVSLMLVDAWWEGATLMGKIKLPITKGFLKFGIVSTPADHIANFIINKIRIGVSSRGLGSVEQSGGYKIVQDDYEVICWDFVGTPSTRGSWTDIKLDGLKKYIERTPEVVEEEENKKEKSSDKITSKLGGNNNWNQKLDAFLSKY